MIDCGLSLLLLIFVFRFASSHAKRFHTHILHLPSDGFAKFPIETEPPPGTDTNTEKQPSFLCSLLVICFVVAERTYLSTPPMHICALQVYDSECNMVVIASKSCRLFPKPFLTYIVAN